MLENISAFLAVVRTGSISQAAQMLFLTQPALTNRIQKLEEMLGVDLFIRRRGAHKMELTQSGKEFIALAERWESLEKNTQQFGRKQSRYFLSVATLQTLTNFNFVPFFSSLILMEPPFDLVIKTRKNAEIGQLVAKQECDLGFINSTTSTHDLNLIRTPLFQESFKFICSPGYKVPQKPVDPARLNVSDEIYMIWNSDFLNWHRVWFDSLERPHIYLDTLPLFREAMLTGRFWSSAPASIAYLLEKDGVTVRDYVTPPPDRIVIMLTRKRYTDLTSLSMDLFSKLLQNFLHHTDGCSPLI